MSTQAEPLLFRDLVASAVVAAFQRAGVDRLDLERIRTALLALPELQDPVAALAAPEWLVHDLGDGLWLTDDKTAPGGEWMDRTGPHLCFPLAMVCTAVLLAGLLRRIDESERWPRLAYYGGIDQGGRVPRLARSLLKQRDAEQEAGGEGFEPSGFLLEMIRSTDCSTIFPTALGPRLAAMTN